MRNKYKGSCYFCNTTVEKNEGHFERYNGGWRTIHASCVFISRALRSYSGLENPTVSREFYVFKELLLVLKSKDKNFDKINYELKCFPRADNKIYIVAFKRLKGGIYTFHAKVMPTEYFQDLNMIQRILNYFKKNEYKLEG